MTSGPGDYGTYEPARFSVTLALSRAIEVLFQNFFTIFAISALATVPLGIYTWLEAHETHIGGGAFLAGWLCLALGAWQSR